MATIRLITVCSALALITLSAPTLADEGRDESGKGHENIPRQSEAYRRPNDDRESYFQRHGYSRLNIPEGHYPPPGECRIWYPDRPPGHQPPPSRCGHDPIPVGAWLIRHPSDNQEHVHVMVYEPEQPGVVHVVGEFDIGSGAFVRVVLDR